MRFRHIVGRSFFLSEKNILLFGNIGLPLQNRCGEICLLATTLKNAKMLTNGDRVARKPLFISMFCVFVTSPHQWDVFLCPDDCQEP